MTDLYTTILTLKDKKELIAFLSDLCTPTELRYLHERWRIAQLLDEKKIIQKDIAAKNKFGIATITRVSRALKDSPYGGYRIALGRLHSSDKKK
ncbi:hypothetical protein FACS18945_5690 [Bacteroidia bacterium]|nr:hypothetical protein FACS18945_5690 [Bacteroidia bacterium]